MKLEELKVYFSISITLALRDYKDIAKSKWYYSEKRKTLSYGFTLAEVLVTLSIIGIVAAMSVPSLQQSMNESEWKTSYRGAFSDASNAFLAFTNENMMKSRTTKHDDNNKDNFELFKSKFQIVKECAGAAMGNCWGNIGENDHDFYSLPNAVPGNVSFIDSKGRSWSNTLNEPFVLVDINGPKKGPNYFGRDRFIFIFSGSHINCLNSTSDGYSAFKGMPVKLVTFCDVQNASNTCMQGKCYYNSWLR